MDRTQLRDPDQSARPPRLGPVLLLCAIVAVCIDLGNIHRFHQADSLIPVLVSLQRWTIFYWCQDRIGMLVPLLAMPFANPFANLLVQDGIYIFSGLAAMFLLPRFVLRDESYVPVGAISAIAFVSLAPPSYCFDFFNNTFYGVWLALGLGGLVLLEPQPDGLIPWKRRAAALVLILLAHWVYSPAALLLVPLVLLRYLFFGEARSKTEFRLSLFFLGLGFAAGVLMMMLVPLGTHHHTDLSTLPLARWPRAWRKLAHNTRIALMPYAWPYSLGLAGGIGLLMVLVPAVRQRAAAAWCAALALSATAASYGLLVCSRLWLEQCDYVDRYSKPLVFLLQAALITVAVAPLFSQLRPPLRRGLNVAMAPLMILAALASYGLPSPAEARNVLDRNLGAATEDILAARCSHVGGSYWRVWPAVFHANLALYELGENRIIWGAAIRGLATWPVWRSMPVDDICIAVPLADDPRDEEWKRPFDFPVLDVVERRASVWILRPKRAGQ